MNKANSNPLRSVWEAAKPELSDGCMRSPCRKHLPSHHLWNRQMPWLWLLKAGVLAPPESSSCQDTLPFFCPGFTFAFHTVVCSAGLEVVDVEGVIAEAEEGSALSEMFGGASLVDSPSSSMSTASCSKLWQIPFQDHGWYMSWQKTKGVFDNKSDMLWHASAIPQLYFAAVTGEASFTSFLPVLHPSIITKILICWTKY